MSTAGEGTGRPGGPLAEMRRARAARAERLALLRGGGGQEAVAEGPAALAAFIDALRAAAEDAPGAAGPAARAIVAPEGRASGIAPEGRAKGIAPEGLAIDIAPEGRAIDIAPEEGAGGVAPEAAVLPFARPERTPGPAAERGGLDRLPGAGPGLVWALRRAGIAGLADLAAASPAPLAERLGPLGGLIDLPAWIDFARGATAGPATRPS